MYVPKTRASVPTVPLLPVLLVLRTTPTFARPAQVNTTKMVTLAVDVILVPFIQDKQQLVHRPPIVYVLKMYVHVPMVPLLPVQLVLHMVATFVRLVLVDFTKMARLVQHADPAVLEQDKRLLVHHRPIVFVLKTSVVVPTV